MTKNVIENCSKTALSGPTNTVEYFMYVCISVEITEFSVVIISCDTLWVQSNVHWFYAFSTFFHWFMRFWQCGLRQGRICMDQVFTARHGFWKVSSKWERCILGVYVFGKGIWYDRSARYAANAKCVWSWMKIVYSSSQFLYR